MITVKNFLRNASFALLTASSFTVTQALVAADASNPFLGYWALTVPGGGPGWLGVTHPGGYYDASLMWIAGSVEPVDSVFFNENGDTLFVTRIHEIKRKAPDGKVARTQRFTELITAKVDGDDLTLTRVMGRLDGTGVDRQEFTGKRIPPLPPAPDLAKVKFGDPITLFNGKDLTGWRLTDPNQANGWSARDGLLINRHAEEHKSYGNLRTDQEFEDFNLTLETRLTKGGNSGVYLRGIYEVQVEDSYGEPLDPHHMGAVYSRITPTVAAEKPAGEWESLDITFVDRHVTVVLNGTKIIDNQPILGCTGGALWSDVTKPGPIYLQGDHTGIDYRNLVIRPVVK
ncbi:MAG: 3-keto-disaccharide hydrolase [Limisphaerales bacterium]